MFNNKFSPEDILQWRRERNEAVGKLDVEIFKAFYQKWAERGYYPSPLPDDNTVEITMYKMAVNIESLPTSRKEEAKDWLRHHGFRDGLL